MPKSKGVKLGVFIDPLTDFGFKFLFSEPNKLVLIGFLNAMLSGRKVVKDVEYASLDHNADLSIHRGVTVDLYCTGQDGERFIVEMQRANQQFFKDRGVFYVSRIINRLGKKGKKWDYRLPEIYFIGIMDFRFDSNSEKSYFHDILLADRNTGEIFYEKLQMIFIELPNFNKGFHTGDDMSKVSEKDKWIYLLKHLRRLDKAPEFLNEWIFNRIFKIARVDNLKEKERMSYESSLKAQRDYHSSMSFAEKKGIERGIEKGIKKGIEKGIEKGKIEEIKNLITKLGLTDKEAARVADVTMAFVKRVRLQLKKGTIIFLALYHLSSLFIFR